ncbi:hypothetical protein BGZ54_010310, partial [Gamsiella multidivaricata]
MLIDFENKNTIPAQGDLIDWLGEKAPGFLITEMLSNVGRCGPCKGSSGFKDSTLVMDLSMMREHVQFIQQANFDPMTYE